MCPRRSFCLVSKEFIVPLSVDVVLGDSKSKSLRSVRLEKPISNLENRTEILSLTNVCCNPASEPSKSICNWIFLVKVMYATGARLSRTHCDLSDLMSGSRAKNSHKIFVR